MGWQRHFRGAFNLCAIAVLAAACDGGGGDAATSDMTSVPPPDVTGTGTIDLGPGVVTGRTVEGPPTPDQLEPGTARACALLSTDEVAAATGLEVVTSDEIDDGVTRLSCQFAADGGATVFGLLITTVANPDPPATSFAAAAAESGAEEVAGLGDGAVWSGDILYVLAGEEMLTMSVTSPAIDPAAARRATIALASAAITRL